MIAVRWYLRYGPVLPAMWRSCSPNVAIVVDLSPFYRRVQRFTPLLIDAARPCRHPPGDRWFVHETSVKGCRAVGLPLTAAIRPVRAGQ